MSDEAKALRHALGNFATGVTIITTVDGEGAPVGLTVSSFNSVSLDPPLILWSLDRRALSLPVFHAAPYFAVHVLCNMQMDLSNRFAKSGIDKFEGVTFERGIGNVPILSGCSAVFQCATVHRYPGGDHIIYVGEVKEYVSEPREPLIFHGGRYARLASAD